MDVTARGSPLTVKMTSAMVSPLLASGDGRRRRGGVGGVGRLRLTVGITADGRDGAWQPVNGKDDIGHGQSSPCIWRWMAAARGGGGRGAVAADGWHHGGWT